MHEIPMVEISEKLLSQQKTLKSFLFIGWHLANYSSEWNNP